LRFGGPSFGQAKTQSLLQLFANIIGNNHLFAFRGPGGLSSRKAVSVVSAV
jgi:hypothetical protein